MLDEIQDIEKKQQDPPDETTIQTEIRTQRPTSAIL